MLIYFCYFHLDKILYFLNVSVSSNHSYSIYKFELFKQIILFKYIQCGIIFC